MRSKTSFGSELLSRLSNKANSCCLWHMVKYRKNVGGARVLLSRGRKSDKEPGMTYIWRGWEKLALISELYSMNPSEMTYGSLSDLKEGDSQDEKTSYE